MITLIFLYNVIAKMKIVNSASYKFSSLPTHSEQIFSSSCLCLMSKSNS